VPEYRHSIGPVYRLPDDECGVPHAGGRFWKRLLASVTLGSKARMRLAKLASEGESSLCKIARLAPWSRIQPSQQFRGECP
jgi:hypothetical protein